MRKYLPLSSLFILAVVLLPPAAIAQDQLWQSFTNMRAIKGYYDPGSSLLTSSRLLVSSPQGVWAATAGGLLLREAGRQTFRRFTNTEGLSQNDTRALGRDRRGRLWVAQANGRIDLYDPEKNAFSGIDDFRPNSRRIYDFLAQGDSMYVALDLGVSLYDVARNEVKETYQNLGRRFPRATTVTALFIDGRDLWTATNIGIARTSLNLPNLLAPESWTNYTTQEGLPSSTVRGFAKFASNLVAATSNGVAAFNGQRWSDVSGNIGAREILQLLTATEANTTTLYAATPFAVYRTQALSNWTRVGGGFSTVITGIIVDAAGTLWASTYDSGLFEFDRTAQVWRAREPDGPATSIFSSVNLDPDGNVWCTSTTNGFQIYDGARWHNYNDKNFPINNNDFRYSIHLANGDHWLASWGSGIYVVSGPLEALAIKAHYDVASGDLSTAQGTTNFPVVPFLKQDGAGNIWILNYNAATTNALLARTPANNVARFSTGDGLRSQEVTVLEIEKTLTTDRIWVGTLYNGVSVLDYQGTVLDKLQPRRDDWSGELTLDDNLLSNRIVSLAQDRDGYMWIGTDKGLNYWFGGGGANARFCYSLINDDVKIIQVDPRNNKWIGTSAGITVLSGEDNCSTTHYTVENSPLVGNFVTSIAFNPNTGDAWIGTTTGLSRFRTPFTEPKADLSQLKGYPNPFLLDERTGSCSSQAGFHITNLAKDSGVRIFNVAGEVVRDYPAEQVPGAQVCWDGRDESGRLVPSGVYLFVAFVESGGASAVGKVAVVRR
jgi:ligand-binding sensor domain-containing protein